jgi:hypothetical protein
MTKFCAKRYITVEKWEGLMKHMKEIEEKSYGGRLLGFNTL